MIIFDLACTHGHRFEGWFASTDDYTHQSERQLVRCPVCDVVDISRIPSARVHTGKAAAPVAAESAPAPPPAARPAESFPIPADVMQKLRAMVKSAEDVGARFPEEARKIHYEETPVRAIRGTASKEDADALRDEGIEVTSLPAFLADDPH